MIDSKEKYLWGEKFGKEKKKEKWEKEDKREEK